MTASAPLVEYDAAAARVLLGAGAVGRVAAEVKRLGCTRVVVFNGLPSPETASRIEAQLGRNQLLTFGVSEQHVPWELAERAAEAAAAADGLVAVGGGSAVGVAKAVALRIPRPIVAVPTTYAGSEMTPIWGITRDAEKMTGRDPAVQPRVVIYDPVLAVDLPPRASAISGVNALAHCVEALWMPNRTPVSTAVAAEGLRRLAAGLRRVVVRPGDLDARTEAFAGSWLAGTALALAGTGVHHKICHVLGGSYGLPHAEVHAAVLPAVVGFYRTAAPEVMDHLSRNLGADPSIDAETALRTLLRDLGAAVGLADLGLTDDAIDGVASAVVVGSPAAPGPVTDRAVREILRTAMHTRVAAAANPTPPPTRP